LSIWLRGRLVLKQSGFVNLQRHEKARVFRKSAELSGTFIRRWVRNRLYTEDLGKEASYLADPVNEAVIELPTTELGLVTLSGDEPVVAEEELEARHPPEPAAQIGDKLETSADEAPERLMFDVFDTRGGSGAGAEPPPPAPLRPASERQSDLVARATTA
jgi:hypothetical protein